MTRPNCPDREQLKLYILGKLSADEIETTSAHTADCDACQAALETMDDLSDDLLSTVQEAVRLNLGSVDREFDELVSRVAAVGPQGFGDDSDRSISRQATDDSALDGKTLRQTGQYRLLEKLGRGGMGAVYKARHSTLKRFVAIKMLPASRMDNPQAIARFQRETESVGSLDHPNIVRAYDAGRDDNFFFLAMEYLDGMDLSQLVRSVGCFVVSDACEVIRQVSAGLQHAHEHGLVHRDIKPSNLMLTRDGQVKILDLGLVRICSEVPHDTEITSSGQLMGTADYIAPEQVSDSRNADIRADIYSLGCTFYHLLTGRTPYANVTHKSTFHKAMAHIQECLPDIKKVNPIVPDELAIVVSRMTAKQPSDRYESPAEVAAALQPFSSGCDLVRLLTRAEAADRQPSRPGESRNPAEGFHESASSEMARAPARYHWPFALAQWRTSTPWRVTATLLMLIVVIGTFLTIVITIRKGDHKTVVRVPDGSKVEVDEQGNVEIEWTKDDSRVAGPPLVTPGDVTGDSVSSQTPASPATPISRPAIGEVRRFTSERVHAVAFAPSGRQVLAAGWNKTIFVWDSVTGEEVRRFRTPTAYIMSMDLSADGKLILAGFRTIYIVVLWDVSTGDRLHRYKGHTGTVHSVAISPDGQFVLTGSADGTARLWELTTEKEIHVFKHPPGVAGVAFTPDGRQALVAGGNFVSVWDVATGNQDEPIEMQTAIHSMAISCEGSVLAMGTSDMSVVLWDLKRGKELLRLEGHAGIPLGIALSPDGDRVLSGGEDMTVRLWDKASGEQIHCFRGHTSEVFSVAFSPDGRHGLSGGQDGTVRIWALPLRGK